jgi:hypothetical protein
VNIKTIRNSIVALFTVVAVTAAAQHEHHQGANATSTGIEPQPLLAQALRIKDALNFLGAALPGNEAAQLEALRNNKPDAETVQAIQQLLDPHCLLTININPEARVKVARGNADARLVQEGWATFLVKVVNEAGSTAQLRAESPNAAFPMHPGSGEPKVKPNDVISEGESVNRFLEIQMYRNRPMLPNLSGLKLEYAIVQIWCKDAGQREAEIGFNIGQGTQDIGFRNTIPVLFTVAPSVKVNLHVLDDDGSPTMASFLITDGIERIITDSIGLKDVSAPLASAQREFYYEGSDKLPNHLRGIYPLPSRRVAATDAYPDFFFQPQVYRADGEHVMLPPGTYSVTCTRGPEYIAQTTKLIVPGGVSSYDATFNLKRWINLASLGYHSADSHVHGAGCSHYDSPEEGVPPRDMWRQALGEDLNVSAVLAWGPSWYHQKTFFTGKDDPLSTKKNIMRADVEVSGFPSSHAGHIVLLNLKEDDYPGTTTIEEWPSWTLPVLQWARSQGGVVGYAHSGWGLQPVKPTTALPFYEMPTMDGIGANEYIVTVTHNAIDFYSAGDTPSTWELTMWYHTLNAGFRTRLSGETDFPCIFDERVGLARSYFKPEGPLSYDNYTDALRKGRGYVSEGNSHILDFAVNGTEVGTANSELSLKGKQSLKITARVAALLPEKQTEAGASIAHRPLDEQPYWHIERARDGSSRNVRVELVVNGFPVDSKLMPADGSVRDLQFDHTIEKSSWVALRILPSSHTNPIFVKIDDKPIVDLKSVQWCRDAVDKCWKEKQKAIRSSEKAAAKTAYDEAKKVYDGLMGKGKR